MLIFRLALPNLPDVALFDIAPSSRRLMFVPRRLPKQLHIYIHEPQDLDEKRRFSASKNISAASHESVLHGPTTFLLITKHKLKTSTVCSLIATPHPPCSASLLEPASDTPQLENNLRSGKAGCGYAALRCSAHAESHFPLCSDFLCPWAVPQSRNQI